MSGMSRVVMVVVGGGIRESKRERDEGNHDALRRFVDVERKID